MTHLIVQKISRKKQVAGDVFSMQFSDSTFCYGKVIKANLQVNNFFKGCHIIFIYNYITTEIIQPSLNLKEFELLLPPIITHKECWNLGYFMTLNNVPVTEEELDLDYGFWYETRKIFVNEEGKKLDTKPKWESSFVLHRYIGIGEDIRKARQGRSV